jgi:hypothetical protein
VTLIGVSLRLSPEIAKVTCFARRGRAVGGAWLRVVFLRYRAWCNFNMDADMWG